MLFHEFANKVYVQRIKSILLFGMFKCGFRDPNEFMKIESLQIFMIPQYI